MNETAAVAHATHESPGFVRTYLFSTDHKMIAKQFLWLGLIMMLLGGLLALMVRWELAWPETQLPLMNLISEKTWEALNESGSWIARMIPNGFISPESYNSLFTMHATIMVFLVVMPILVGTFGNFLIPLQIGAPDMAFPVLNMLSFWTTALGGLVMLAGFFVPGGHAAGGWTAYAPLSAQAIYTGVNWGQHLWLISLFILGVGSLMGSINYITTVINMRARGMTWFRMPLTIWSLFITAVLLLFALPVLQAAAVLLLFDRTLGTSFYLPAGGGEPLLWQHLFWFFGHPEVYVLILPAMGIVCDILPVFSRKPIFGYKAMAVAMISIAFLGFIVWGHHMFISGMNPSLAVGFSITTILISVPAALITMNWIATLFRASIRFTTPMLFALGVVSMFIIGGLSGIFLGLAPTDIFLHDTYFVVAHFHYIVFGFSILGIFAGIYFWFPKMFGRKLNETLGKIHFLATFITFNLVFFPMHMLGIGGHMRRIYNPLQYPFLEPLQPMNVFITVSAFLLGASQILFMINFFWGLAGKKTWEQNPWEANTLEWTAAPPRPPHGNFLTPPIVHHGPYVYSLPGSTQDWAPQNEELPGKLARAAAG
ncbi:MAG: cbb3-type cytochrome c oxidase subunit I [Candidatus Tectomicrobia bacterium]|nr:cbb3-type cytochrome c oxidase subunit I [Candidatus Tectomicrobia bacterium]